VAVSFSTYILYVRASHYMVIRVHVHGLFCNNVLHLRKLAYFCLPSFKVAACMNVNIKLEIAGSSETFGIGTRLLDFIVLI
jgi:hypothetical protein